MCAYLFRVSESGEALGSPPVVFITGSGGFVAGTKI